MLQALTRSGEAETAKALLGQKLQHACMLASVAGQLQIATVRCVGGE
jgi:predicted metal-binding protein